MKSYESVADFLEASLRWRPVSASEIAMSVGKSPVACSREIAQLRRWSEVEVEVHRIGGRDVEFFKLRRSVASPRCVDALNI